MGYVFCDYENHIDKFVLKSTYLKSFFSIFFINEKIIFGITLILSIAFIILDNHYIYESIIKSEIYIVVRERVRLYKKVYGFNYKEKDKSKDNSANKSLDSLSIRIREISSNKRFIDELKIKKIIGSNRLEQMKSFLDIYRNSSSLSNTIILGDIIHEFLGSQIDTLFIPFTSPTYCFDLAQTLWCQIESLSWFIYPIIVEKYDDYSYKLSQSQYKNIKQNQLTVEGSDNTLINIPITCPLSQRQNYYLFSYMNEIFVYSLNDIIGD